MKEYRAIFKAPGVKGALVEVRVELEAKDEYEAGRRAAEIIRFVVGGHIEHITRTSLREINALKDTGEVAS
jgi:hypothetical protein